MNAPTRKMNIFTRAGFYPLWNISTDGIRACTRRFSSMEKKNDVQIEMAIQYNDTYKENIFFFRQQYQHY
jgi:DNA gyrase/topoisomerase IV subunit B